MPASTCSSRNETCDSQFLALLPKIENTARFLCLRLNPEAREEAIAEVIANAFVAFTRLMQQNRANVATAGSLARFGVRQFFAGRRVGGRLNGHDILSPYACRKHRLQLERLEQQDERGNWQEVLVEDRTATPADLAASRIDVANWLEQLPGRIRSIALMLADGYSTGEVATRFRLSPGRVSQLRRELAERWRDFQSEPQQQTVGLAAT